MPKAKKLPSGSWRCKAQVNGNRKSFTVKDPSAAGRRECERQAAEWAAKMKQAALESMSVEQCIAGYVSARKDLSPTTLAGYISLQNHVYENINEIFVENLSEKDISMWIQTLSVDHSAKTCQNAHGLLSAAVKYFGGTLPAVRLPSRPPIDYAIPTDADVAALIARAKKTDPDMAKAIMLAAFGTLRCGEVCALTYDDFDGDYVTISKSMARTASGQYVLKSPKTQSSVRSVKLPHNVVAYCLRKADKAGSRIIALNNAMVTNRFRKLIRDVGCQQFRFHDLRAYAASSRHALGIPDQYIMADGGWKTPSVMTRVYRRAMQDKRDQFADISNAHYKKVSTKMSTKAKK